MLLYFIHDDTIGADYMSSQEASPGLITAAGGIVEKKTPLGVRIALIYRELYGSEWALPKGKQERGESLDQTAIREVLEESGCEARITEYAGCTRYHHGSTPKIVFFWRMEAIGECCFVPSSEIREMEWVDPQTAIERLRYPEEKDLVRRFYD